MRYVSECRREADIDLAAGQVVGDSILDIVHVGDPVVAAHVRDVHQVEAVQSQPDLLEMAEQAARGAMVLADEFVAQSDIHALVGWLADVGVGTSHVWRSRGQTVAQDALEAELQSGNAGEVVGKEQRDAIALVGGTRHLHAIEVFLGLHQREAEPGVGTLDKLAEQFHVHTGNVTLGRIHAAIDQLQVVDLIGNQVRQVLVVGLGRELEGAVKGPEGVVAAQDDLDAAL